MNFCRGGPFFTDDKNLSLPFRFSPTTKQPVKSGDFFFLFGWIFCRAPYLGDIFPYITDETPYIADDIPYIADI